MAAIAATDVTYASVKLSNTANGGKNSNGSITFGDGTLTYPSGGVPLTAAKLGLPNTVDTMLFYDEASANGFVYKYDAANQKIRIYQGDNTNVAAAPLVELTGSATPAAATLKYSASGW